MTHTKGTRLVVTKADKMFIGTVTAHVEDYYLVRDRNGKTRFAYEGEFVTFEEYYS